MMKMKKLVKFAGNTKKGAWFFQKYEQQLRSILLRYVPASIQTYHLTCMTLIWAECIVLFGFLASTDTNWLWGISLMIIFQYITDLLDGEVGRQRKTGLIKWGYYMDHFLDYVFLCSIVVAYSFLLPETHHPYLLVALAVLSGFMVHTFLLFNIMNELRMSQNGIGPTEGRALLILSNTLMILFGVHLLTTLLPYVLLVLMIFLVIIVYRAQRRIWRIDMKNNHD